MSNRQDRPLAKKLLHALGLLALALFLLYVAVQFVLIFHRSYKTETAIRYTLAESLNLTGVVAFDAVDVPGSGNLGYLVQDGERVTNGTVVAECYTDDTQGLQRERLDRLERSITLLTKSQNSAGSELSVLTNQTKQALYNLLDKLDTAQYTGISDAQDSFLLAQNRLQISTGQTADFSQSIAALQTEYDGIKAQLDTLQTVTATTNGYFSRTEASPAIRTDCRALADADPATLQKCWQTASRQRIQTAPDRSRRASAGNSTRSAIWIPPHGSTVCPTVKISVTRQQNHPAFPPRWQEVTEDKDNGIAKIVLQCQTISAEVLGLGCETVQVDLKTYEGIRIDKAALHIVNGQRGVYVKYGNLQRFLKITTLYENDNYILVPEDGKLGSANEVRLYDEIIVQGTNLEDGKLL